MKKDDTFANHINGVSLFSQQPHSIMHSYFIKEGGLGIMALKDNQIMETYVLLPEDYEKLDIKVQSELEQIVCLVEATTFKNYVYQQEHSNNELLARY